MISKDRYILVALVVFIILTSSLSLGIGDGRSAVSPFHESQAAGQKKFELVQRGSQVVFPHFSYQAEPAPMGIVDYGLGKPATFGYYSYNYSTTKFLGIVRVTSISTYNSSPEVTYNLSIQLNLNLVFYNNNSLFVYWIQNVAFLNSNNNSIQFIDNVWNFSSPSSSMLNSTIEGNGTIARSGHSLFYYDVANNSLPGNNISLKKPYTIELLSVSTLRNGSPAVIFEYNDGYGWVTYDLVTFKFARNTDPDGNFYVDGSTTNPIGTNYDAELILGGPGNGSSTEDLSSTLYLSLEYWNGHNFQEVPNAFNFGSDTAETIWNVFSMAYYNETTGMIFTNVTAGPGSLLELYQSSEVSTIDLRTGLPAGNLSVGGLNYTFQNNWVNITIGPGNYSLKLYDSEGLLIWYRNISAKAGEVLSLIAKALYNVTFFENNLPYGSFWGVNISGIGSLGPFTNSTITIQLPNGTYNLSVYTENKNYRSPPPLEFIILGSHIEIYLNFTLITFPVKFIEVGLPPGTWWTVMIKGKSFNSSESSIVIYESNGSYLFQIDNASGYTPNITNGPLIVRGKPVTVNISFFYYVYLVGNITPKSATLYINGKPVNVHSGHFNITLKAGSYSLKAASFGYSTYTASINLNNTSKVHFINITLNSVNYDEYYFLVIALVAIVIAMVIYRKKR
ncbi:MAG: thermopsin [Thermoplasmatales archaeon]